MASSSRLGFDVREQRVVADLARWMGLLGRFQVVAASFVFLLLLAVAALVTTIEVLEPTSGEGLPVSIGEVSRTTMATVVAVVLVVTIVFLRGGMLLIGSAEDLEAANGEDPRVIELLDSALRRLRTYFVLESLLMAALAASTYAATILRWPGL
jgi:hypothetical protein